MRVWLLRVCVVMMAWTQMAYTFNTVQAADAPTTASDPVLEAQVQRVASELRCLVCQNQTIADSHAELAIDLRNQVRDMLKRGDSEQQIIEYMTARYGDFVLYRPAFKPTTYLLWLGPFVLLVLGLVMLWRVLRQRRPQNAATELSAQERERVQSLLKDGA